MTTNDAYQTSMYLQVSVIATTTKATQVTARISLALNLLADS